MSWNNKLFDRQNFVNKWTSPTIGAKFKSLFVSASEWVDDLAAKTKIA